MASIRALFFAPPDEVLVEIAAGGEKFAAYTRLYFVLFIWSAALILTLLLGKDRPEFIVVSLGTTVMVAVACFYVYTVLSKNARSASHFMITITDISLISCTLFALAYLNKPELAVNSMVVWEGYLLFILASSLYFDVRVCIVATLTAMIQYALILWWCATHFDFPIAGSSVAAYNGLVLYVQLARFMLMIIAAMICIGIILRSRSLLSLSGTDTLTGLPNRRIFEATLAQEISRSKRHQMSFSLVYFDLDHFKQFNSKWGHDMGDRVLKIMASAMKQGKRTEDLVARWGGEEFVAIFPNTNKQDAVTLTDRLRNYLKSGNLPIPERCNPVTFSAGIAEFGLDGEDGIELLRIADTRLSKAKLQGRDQVVIEG